MRCWPSKRSAFEERQVCLRLRSQLPPYLAGIPGKRWANEALKHVSTLTDVEGILLQLLERNA